MYVYAQSFHVATMVLLQYNFTVPCVSTSGTMRNLQCISIGCLCGPRFLVSWNMHCSCNLPYVIHGIVRHGIAMHVIAKQATNLDKDLTSYRNNATKRFFS